MEYIGSLETTGNVLVCDPIYASTKDPAVVASTGARLRQWIGVAPGMWNVVWIEQDRRIAAAIGRTPSERPSRLLKVGSVGIDSGTIAISIEEAHPKTIFDGLKAIIKTGDSAIIGPAGVITETHGGDGYFPIFVENVELPSYFEIRV